MHKKRNMVIAFITILCIVACIAIRQWPQNNYVKQMAYKEKAQANVTNIRFASFNIKSLGLGKALHTAIEEIKQLDADILVLQEVHKDAKRFQGYDMTSELQLNCDYPYAYFYPTMWQIDGYYGLAILSRFPIKEVSSLRLPNQLLQEPRILAKALVVINGEDYQVYTTHIAYKDRAVRLKQIERVMNEVQNTPRTVLMGDFNTFRVKELFHIEGMDAITNVEHQYKTFRGFGFPDQIFYSHDLNKQGEGMFETAFSDHHALYIDVSL